MMDMSSLSASLEDHMAGTGPQVLTLKLHMRQSSGTSSYTASLFYTSLQHKNVIEIYIKNICRVKGTDLRDFFYLA
jgi:hypothetical protein